MLFNSYEFIFIFLPVSISLYFFLQNRIHAGAAILWLVALSLIFYGWWNPIYIPLIMGSIAFNYVIGTFLTKKRETISSTGKKFILVFAIVLNLLLLGYFKYSDFFISNLNAVTGTAYNPLKVVLPLGISFFTFTQIAYIVDTYKGVVTEYGLSKYSLFVTFFPHLLAGPIIHHKEMMPQFEALSGKRLNYESLSKGVFLFAIGLFKKVVIADTFALWANNGFNSISGSVNMIDAWIMSLSYTFQIYFDFSGYTDMALGAALMFNIKLPANFHSPYKSLNIQEFWRRWHITLSRFMREYIYIPLGGNRTGESRILFNLFITFLIGGLWHGASWTFVFWGVLHGLAILAYRMWGKINIAIPDVLAWALTFNFVNMAWIFFRAKNFPDAIAILKGMLGFGQIALPKAIALKLSFLNAYGIQFNIAETSANLTKPAIFIIMATITVLCFHNSNELVLKFKPDAVHLFCVMTVLLISILHLGGHSEFLYFQF